MTSRDFAFWLQGYLELSAINGQAQPLSAAQVVMIKQHLALCFKHEIDPSMGDPAHQNVLDAIHQGGGSIHNEIVCATPPKPVKPPRPPKPTVYRC